MNIIHFLISNSGLRMYVIKYPIDMNVIASKLMNKRKASIYFGRKTEEEKAVHITREQNRPFFGYTDKEGKFITKQFTIFAKKELRKKWGRR